MSTVIHKEKQFVILLALLASFNLNAEHFDIPTSCDQDIIEKYGCNMCYKDPEYLEVGKSQSLSRTITNSGDYINRYYQSDLEPPEVWNTYGVGIVTFAIPEWEYDSDFFKNCSKTWCQTPSGKKLIYLNPGETVKAEKTVAGKNLGVISIDSSKINELNKDNILNKNFTIVYKTKAEFRSKDQTEIIGSNSLKVCASIGIKF